MHRPGQTVSWYRKRLPHWEVSDAPYFVTLNLIGSLPRHVVQMIQRINQTLRRSHLHSSDYQFRHVFALMEKWLHANQGHRWLEAPEVAQIVADSIEYFVREEIWNMHSYVIMPNHLHMKFMLLPASQRYRQEETGILDGLMDSFKRYTGRAANRVLDRTGNRFWMREWYDHWIRDRQEADRNEIYIRDNPVKAGLVTDWRDWSFGSWSVKQEKR